ncbi:MAG: hypothetical protein E4G96_11170 [Chrysiogenales bacterium]|nr:MAG: hypothetical protein E4G96_11170 [Chrysiogenales bacterium]
MKRKAIIALIPVLFLAFTQEDTGKPLYYNSLKFIKQADGPRSVTMVLSGRRQGQSTMLSRGVLFTYGNRGARNVLISGNFSGWNPIKMQRSDNGIWYYFLEAVEKRIDLTYKYMVDGIWIVDTLNDDRIDDRMGSYLSVIEPPLKTEGKHVTWRYIGKNEVEFRLHRPDASFVSIVGDLNNWSPEDDLLARGPDGTWRLRKRLFPGQYRYTYIIDGEWLPDTYNPHSGSDASGMVCSIIEIKK